MTARQLRAVQDGEKPKPAKKAPAKKRAPRTVAHAATLSRKTLLETVRNKIAATMDDPRSHPRDVINAAKQLLDVQAQIDALGGKPNGSAAGPAEPSAIADTPNERWDESAI